MGKDAGRHGPDRGLAPVLLLRLGTLHRGREVILQRSTAAHLSIWERTSSPPPAGAAPAAGRYDVIVIGSGIAGMTTAYLLAREDRRVLVLEAEPDLFAVQSAKTTAHLSNVLDDRFQTLE